MSKKYLFLSIYMILVACTDSWIKENASQSEIQQDKASCQYESEREAPLATKQMLEGGDDLIYAKSQGNIDPSAGIDRQLAKSHVQNKLYSQCLQRKGYHQ